MTTAVAFEFPKVSHPDLEVDWHVEYYIHPSTGKQLEAFRDHRTVWMKGCKTCNNCLSECGCGDRRVESKLKLYERAVRFGEGDITENFYRFFPRAGTPVVVPAPAPEPKSGLVDDVTNMMLRGGPSGDIESGIADYLKARLVQLPEDDLKVVRTDLSKLGKTKDSKRDEIERVYRKYLGISDVLLSHIQEIYIHYPLSKFPEMVRLFHKYKLPLTVRPKPEPGPDTKAAKGLGPDQGGLGGRLRVRIPNDVGVANAINKMLDEEGLDIGAEYETHNVKVVMTLLLIFKYRQEKPIGPEWESEERKRQMYESYGLLNLL